MVGHQAIGVNLALKPSFPFLQRLEIKEIIVVPGENNLSVVTALNDVVRGVGED
jgi:hypothetical protein